MLIPIERIELNTSSTIICLPDDSSFDFRDCKDISQIKIKIENEFIPLCSRSKSAHVYCSRFLKGREEKICPLQLTFLNNYLESTIRFIPKHSAYHVKEYLEYLLCLLRLVDKFNQWQGGILNKSILKWQDEAILRFDKYWFRDINLELAKVIDKYISIEPTDNSFYRFKIFVEGKDDQAAITKVGEKIQFYIFSDSIELLEGEGNVQNNIRFINKLIKDNWDIFFFMDNEGKWYKAVKKHFLDKNLIKNEQIFKFNKSLEDSYPWQIQKQAFEQLNVSNGRTQFNESFFRTKSKLKLVDRIQKILLKLQINFKKDYKEDFNKNLLNCFLQDYIIKNCELVRNIKRVMKLISEHQKAFYQTQ